MKRSAFIILSSLALAACGAAEQPATEEVPEVQEQAAPADEAVPPAEDTMTGGTEATTDTTAHEGEGEGSH